MTASRPAAATQTRVRISPVMHPKVFFMSAALSTTTLRIAGHGDQVRILPYGLPVLRLGYNVPRGVNVRHFIILGVVDHVVMPYKLPMQQTLL